MDFNAGSLTNIFKIEDSNMDEFYNQLKHLMSGFYSYEGMGTEFYKKEVMEHLEWYFMVIGVNYSKLTPEEIAELHLKIKQTTRGIQ